MSTGSGFLSSIFISTTSNGNTFLGLSDTPGSYAGQSGEGLRVDAGETGLEFYTIVGGTDEKVGVDAAATPGYLGAAFNDGVLRVDSTNIDYTDGGDYVTLAAKSASELWNASSIRSMNLQAPFASTWDLLVYNGANNTWEYGDAVQLANVSGDLIIGKSYTASIGFTGSFTGTILGTSSQAISSSWSNPENHNHDDRYYTETELTDSSKTLYLSHIKTEAGANFSASSAGNAMLVQSMYYSGTLIDCISRTDRDSAIRFDGNNAWTVGNDNSINGSFIIADGNNYPSAINIINKRFIIDTAGYVTASVGITSSFTGSYKGIYTGSFTGSSILTGSFTGNYTGAAQLTGSYSGTANLTGTYSGAFSGSYTGALYGPVTGNLLGTASAVDNRSYRYVLQGFYDSPFTADVYCSASFGIPFDANTGWPVPRSGSIVGLSTYVQCTAKTTNGDVITQVRVNDVSVFTKTLTITSTGYKSGSIVQNAGADVFNVDDKISFYLDITTFTGSLRRALVLAELEFTY